MNHLTTDKAFKNTHKIERYIKFEHSFSMKECSTLSFHIYNFAQRIHFVVRIQYCFKFKFPFFQ